MTSTKTKAARNAATTVAANEYVRRLVEDEELRDSIRDAFDASKTAYGRVQKQKHPAKAVLDDKRTQRELREAAESLRAASDRLRGKKDSSGSTLGKLLVVAVVGAVAAVVLSEHIRKAVLDRLFGAEEEFEYTSTSAPSNGGAA
jgi:hypothetical protein